MRLMFLGDIHGNMQHITDYIKRLSLKNTHIIQVGDWGVGFGTLEKDKRYLSLYHNILVKNNIFIWAIRGNHDYKPYFDNDPFGFTNIKLVSDYTVLNLCNKNILCIGGAVSIDRKSRYTKLQKQGNFEKLTGAESWWSDEVFVLDIEKLKKFRDIDIVVTHTSPYYCPPDNTFGFGDLVDHYIKGDSKLKEDLLFERYQLAEAFLILGLNNDITNAYYGHFHHNNDITINGIKFTLLGINELCEQNLINQ